MLFLISGFDTFLAFYMISERYIMRNVSFHDNDSEPDARRSFISIDGDGNEAEANKVLEELNDCSVVSRTKSVRTRTDEHGDKKAVFYLYVYFDNGADTRKAYTKLGGL